MSEKSKAAIDAELNQALRSLLRSERALRRLLNALPDSPEGIDENLKKTRDSAEKTAGRLRKFLDENPEVVARLEGIRDSIGDVDEVLTGVSDSVDTITSYPLLTRETWNGGSGGSDASVASGSSGAAIGGTVANAMKQVLGWRPGGAESGAVRAKSFVAALTRSFDCTELEGRTVCTWMPRSYAVQTDLGAVTGAQASLYSRARVALDHALPILDGLRPLRSDADAEDVHAARLVARSQFTELVEEFGQPGGPRVQRIDALFESLLGVPLDAEAGRPEEIGGLLGDVREEFGLRDAEVATVDEEKTLTDFLIVVDHVCALRTSWRDRQAYFDREGNDVYLGTELILLNRALAVTVESVGEARVAMDSVFLGEAERGTTRLTFPPKDSGKPEPAMFVAELLDWVERFAGENAVRLIDDGGRAGVAALFPTIDRLVELCRWARIERHGGQQDPSKLPNGYSTPRVQGALAELVGKLAEVQLIAQGIRDSHEAAD